MTNVVVHGKSGIRVEVVLHSISEAGQEIITFLRDYPRIVHAEDLKHRMFSNSAASSRAIPFSKMTEQLKGRPVRFGQANPGMQDKGEEFAAKVRGSWGQVPVAPDIAWNDACDLAVGMSKNFHEAGFSKQVYNRLTEPFQMIRVLTTATETDNFYWLRDDPAADPTIREVARCMREAHKQSVPQKLKAGEWHLPFVDFSNWDTSKTVQGFYVAEVEGPLLLSLEEAIKVSCARCAATSFRNTDYNLEKSLQVYDRLVNGDKIHAGALEHCATPMQKAVANIGTHMTRKDYVNVPNDPSSWEAGVSHCDRQRKLWSGNFKGWVQYRKTIPGENYTG